MKDAKDCCKSAKKGPHLKDCPTKAKQPDEIVHQPADGQQETPPQPIASGNDQMDKLNRLEARLDSLTDALEKVVSIVTAEPEPETPKPMPEVETSTVTARQMADAGAPVPAAWRAKADELLGKEFGMEITDSANGNFIMTIRVPKQWDRRVGDRNGDDISTGLIRRASALDDVSIWCTRIANNIRKTYPKFNS